MAALNGKFQPNQIFAVCFCLAISSSCADTSFTSGAVENSRSSSSESDRESDDLEKDKANERRLNQMMNIDVDGKNRLENFKSCPKFDDYTSFIGDGKKNTLCLPLLTEEDFQAVMVLMRDGSSSMRSFNSAYGNAIKNNTVLQAAKFNATTFDCYATGSGDKATQRIFSSLGYQTGVYTSAANYCSSGLRAHLNNLQKPHHFIIFLIIDYTPFDIPLINTEAKLHSFLGGIEKLKNIASVSVHGALETWNPNVIERWISALPERMVGYFQDGAQVNVNTVFENVAASVKQRQILRVVNLESYPDALNDAKLYLNNQRLQPGDYKIQGQKVILDDAVDVNEDDVIVLRY